VRRPAVRDARYLDVLPLPGGGHRIWYEARLPNESHELRTDLIDKPDAGDCTLPGDGL